MPEVVRTSRTLLGIVAHKADRLDEAREHLDAALTLALDAGDRTDEAYCRQELGFLLLDAGDPEPGLGEFHAVLALAPGVGIVNLAGNGLNGMGAVRLQLGRAAEAVPFLLAALAIRAELEDLEQQYVDLAHLATVALALGNSSIAARIVRFLDGHPDTAAGMYGHDRRTMRAVLEATAGVDADPAANFDEARLLTAGIGASRWLDHKRVGDLELFMVDEPAHRLQYCIFWLVSRRVLEQPACFVDAEVVVADQMPPAGVKGFLSGTAPELVPCHRAQQRCLSEP
jgi:hypothetical protein